ncbi:MAG: GNAT family N-acetyltransferase [Paramuribaculum sp.]|nr:GNAT family N-acetyltransferase [Paramuribaculum sp.]
MNRKDEIRRIWTECFDDSREFVEMFFSRVYRESDALTLEKGGKIVSSMLLQPYTMKFQGTEVTTGYICGAATRRAARGNGYMSELMVEALNTALNKGYMTCSLIPAHDWLYFYYDRFDFSTVYYYDPQRFTSLHAFTPNGRYTRVEDPYLPEVFDAFHAFEMGRRCTILHSQRDFLNIIDDLSHDGGIFVALRDDTGSIAAIGFAAPADGRLLVKDLLGDSEDAREAVLSVMRNEFPDTPVSVYSPAGDNGRKPYSRGMARILISPLCIVVIAAANPALRTRIRITDKLLPHNSHTYIIKEGNCVIDDSYTGKLDFDVNADTFNKIVFSGEKIGNVLEFPSERPYMSLMLD